MGFHPEEAGEDFRGQYKMVERFARDIQVRDSGSIS